MIAIVMLANTSIVSPNEVRDVVQETGIKTIPIEKKCKKAKWLSEAALKIAVNRREVKSKGEKERYKHLNADFQRNPRADLLQNGLAGSLCSPRDSQESSPTSQFKTINSLALSLLHSPTLTSIHDHRKNHSLD